MARFTVLAHDDLSKLVEVFGLGVLLNFRTVEAGTINSNYLVEASTGRFFLRVNEGKSESEVAVEVDVLCHLEAAGVATPLPVRCGSGQRYAAYLGKFISVFPWCEGTHSDSKSISVPQCHAVGASLGHLHKVGHSFRVDTGGRYSFVKVREIYNSFRDSEEVVLADPLRVIGEELAWLAERLEQRRALPGGLIHADLFPDNVLLQGDTIVALLDFEQACRGTYAYDLAVCINAWCFADSLVDDRVRALVAGYESERPLSKAERNALSIELRGAALRFTVTRIRDVYLAAEGASQEGAVGGKDFRRFLMRLRTWQQASAERIAELATPLAEA